MYITLNESSGKQRRELKAGQVGIILLLYSEGPTYWVRVYCAIAQWFEVCLVLCCVVFRFNPLPAELPWKLSW